VSEAPKEPFECVTAPAMQDTGKLSCPNWRSDNSRRGWGFPDADHVIQRTLTPCLLYQLAPFDVAINPSLLC